jgi:hypothetical protein
MLFKFIICLLHNVHWHYELEFEDFEDNKLVIYSKSNILI